MNTRPSLPSLCQTLLPNLRALVPAALLGTLVLTGCSGNDESAQEPQASTSPSADASDSASEAALEKPPTPRLGACYDLTVRDAARTASTAASVSCRKAHTTMTIHVGKLGAKGRLAPDVEQPSVRDRLTRTCNRELTTFLGGDPTTLRLSRFQVVWFAPTEDELGAGADWVRCDVLAFGRKDELMSLPKLRLRGVLDRPVGLATFGLCGTAAPGEPGFERVACGQRHSWTAISTIALTGGDRYPGEQRVRAAGDETCADQVNDRTSELEFDYGWEWPTREQWRAGQRYGYCWAPAALA